MPVPGCRGQIGTLHLFDYFPIRIPIMESLIWRQATLACGAVIFLMDSEVTLCYDGREFTAFELF